MKMNQRLAAIPLLLGLAIGAGQAEQVAIVKKDRVNVRGQANAKSEVITQLHKGEAVNVLEEIPVKNPKKGEPAAWMRIQLPANTPVWVYAPYIESAAKTVNIRRVNIRSGPGENFSILGRLDRGAGVKEIRTVERWMEIEAPTNAFAYVAADLLEKAPAKPEEAKPTEIAANTPAPTPPPTTETVKTEPVPAPATETTPAPTPPATTDTKPATTDTAPATAPAASGTIEPAPQVVPETPPRRTVSREGVVIVSRSIQAPTDYALENMEARRTINYLHSEDPALKLKNFAGRRVIVTGEELLDRRWAHTPIIEVETIRLVH
jgi:uncharacterized protein YgiM (DUF1202 family)